MTAFAVGHQQPPHWPQHPWDWLVWAEFSYPFNLSHGPAISVPCGLTADGLPSACSSPDHDWPTTSFCGPLPRSSSSSPSIVFRTCPDCHLDNPLPRARVSPTVRA